MFVATFWKGAFERAVRTFLQVFVGFFVAGVTVISLDWGGAFVIAGTATLLSLIMSVLATNVGGPGPSFGPEVLEARVATYTDGAPAPKTPIWPNESTGGYTADDKK